jgi:hypothetical protein
MSQASAPHACLIILHYQDIKMTTCNSNKEKEKRKTGCGKSPKPTSQEKELHRRQKTSWKADSQDFGDALW